MSSFPASIVLSGNYNGGVNNQGNNGNWWSSTVASGTNAHNLNVNGNNSNVNPTNSNSKYNGFSLRCIVSGS